jgi:transcriptional regulator with XRE-family HTH domain
MAELTPEACKAARALLGWGVRDLASMADVGVVTISRLEAGDPIGDKTKDKIKAAFAKANVEITNGEGTGARLLLRKKGKRK